MSWLFVALGGAIGASGRYAISLWIAANSASHFPWSTWLVNVIGSFLMGVVFVCVVEQQLLNGYWRQLLSIGLLGAFTTFSTFSLDALSLVNSGFWLQGLMYILSTVVVCFVAVAVAVAGSRLLF